jgi:hypothetical protein
MRHSDSTASGALERPLGSQSMRRFELYGSGCAKAFKTVWKDVFPAPWARTEMLSVGYRAGRLRLEARKQA